MSKFDIIFLHETFLFKHELAVLSYDTGNMLAGLSYDGVTILINS